MPPIIVGNVVAEGFARPPNPYLDVTVTEFVPKSTPTNAVWLCIVSVNMSKPGTSSSGGGTINGNGPVAVTDNARIGSPCHIPNVLSADMWGVVVPIGSPSLAYTISWYEVLNDMPAGTTIRITPPANSGHFQARLHRIDGLKHDSYNPTGCDVTIPNPPFSPTGPFRPIGKEANSGRVLFAGTSYVSDLTVLIGCADWSGYVGPGSAPTFQFDASGLGPVYPVEYSFDFLYTTGPEIVKVFYTILNFAPGHIETWTSARWEIVAFTRFAELNENGVAYIIADAGAGPTCSPRIIHMSKELSLHE